MADHCACFHNKLCFSGDMIVTFCLFFYFVYKESPLLGATQTPVSKLLKKVENVNTGSVMSIPKHHKKVSYREIWVGWKQINKYLMVQDVNIDL